MKKDLFITITKQCTQQRRVNDKLLTVKEVKILGKEYENKGYKVNLSLSEF